MVFLFDVAWPLAYWPPASGGASHACRSTFAKRASFHGNIMELHEGFSSNFPAIFHDSQEGTLSISSNWLHFWWSLLARKITCFGLVLFPGDKGIKAASKHTGHTYTSHEWTADWTPPFHQAKLGSVFLGLGQCGMSFVPLSSHYIYIYTHI